VGITKPWVKWKSADVERRERHSMSGDLLKKRPAPGIAFEQSVDVQEGLGVLPTC
jgi:hypothetical protein